MRLLWVLWASVLATAAPASAADQFDLVCTGTEQTGYVEALKEKPYSRHYRIDLKAGRWCAEDCQVTKPVAEAQPALIRLEPSSTKDEPSGRTMFDWQINRTTGDEKQLYSNQNGERFFITKILAACTASPFSGFPKVKAKF